MSGMNDMVSQLQSQSIVWLVLNPTEERDKIKCSDVYHEWIEQHMHGERGRIGYLKMWGHENVLLLPYNLLFLV